MSLVKEGLDVKSTQAPRSPSQSGLVRDNRPASPSSADLQLLQRPEYHGPQEEARCPWGSQAGHKTGQRGQGSRGEECQAACAGGAQETIREGGDWRRLMDGQIARQYAVGTLPEAEMGETRV